MNISTLCKCAERYDMLCNVVDTRELSNIIASKFGMNDVDLWDFIAAGANESARGTALVSRLENNPYLCGKVLMNENFFALVEDAINV